MRALFLILPFLLLFTSGEADQRVLYLSDGAGITVFRVETSSGKLSKIQKVEESGLTVISSDKTYLYRAGGSEIESYLIKADGTLVSLGKSPTEISPVYLDINAGDSFIAGSNYKDGTVTIWSIPESRIATGAPVAELTLEKTAHSSVFSKNNRYLLVPATTPNKVFQLTFDSTSGAIAPNDPPFADGPTGDGSAQQPRHLVFHPDLPVAYTTLERKVPGVGVWNWDASSGELAVAQNIPTTPEGFEGAITTADLHLTPDAKFLYVSNRDLTDRKAITGNSSLVGFQVNPTDGHLALIGHTPCPQVPRAFAIDEAGEYLYCAGQTAAGLATYRINPDTGALSLIEEFATDKSPNWIRCLTLP